MIEHGEELIHQILFMVGRGYLKPDMAKLRPDTPAKLRNLTLDCCKFVRDDRPEFNRISPALEALMNYMKRLQPKLTRRHSEPLLSYRTHLQDGDFLQFPLSSPKTPVNILRTGGDSGHHSGAFTFLTPHNNAVL